MPLIKPVSARRRRANVRLGLLAEQAGDISVSLSNQLILAVGLEGRKIGRGKWARLPRAPLVIKVNDPDILPMVHPLRDGRL